MIEPTSNARPAGRGSARLAVLAVCGLLAVLQGQDVVRTGDIAARGLKNSDFPRISKLADRVWAYEQVDPTKRIVTVNNLIVATARGVVVADGQGTVENTKRLVADIATLTPLPIVYVIVCSEHGDHTGGNSAFPSSAVFVSSPFSKGNLERQANTPTQRGNTPPTVVPTEVVSRARTLEMGDTDIQILALGRAHTGGDLVVYLPREKILWMSEVFSNRIFPSMANSRPSEWLDTLTRAERMDVSVFVPAHGFVDSPAILNEEERNFHAALARVIAEGRRLHDAKVPIERAVASADFGALTGWTRYSDNVAGAVARVYGELDGTLGP
jgi:glyoxylase-like metal-dependent hydrolase (beta-lactamase superfamily II)